MQKKFNVVALFLGLLAGGLATWFQPYREIFFWGMDYRLVMVLAVLVFSFLFKLVFRHETVKVASFIGSGAVIALIFRIMYDVFRDFTAHFEWPMEITLFALLAFASSFVGTYLGELINWSKKAGTK